MPYSHVFAYVLDVQNLFFTIPLVVLAVLGLFELISLLLGLSVFKFLDDLLPGDTTDAGGEGTEIKGPDIEAGEAGTEHSGSETDLQVMDIHVPLSIRIVLVLSTYGILGLLFMGLNYSLLATAIPSWVLAIIAAICCAAIQKPISKLFTRIVGQETTAIRIESLSGHRARITVGRASAGNPAEAKVEDRYGHDHFVRVIPHKKEEVLEQGSTLLLIEYMETEGVFTAIRFEDRIANRE